MAHLHSILRPTMSQRLDVVAENEKALAACGRGDPLLDPEAANQMATYFDRYISEIQPPPAPPPHRPARGEGGRR